MGPCDTVAKHTLPCVFKESIKMFKISASEFDTLGMCRRMRACTDEFLATVTEGVVQSVYKVVTRSSFSVTWPHKVSGGKWMFHTLCHNFTYEPDMVVEGQGYLAQCLELWLIPPVV